MKTKCLFYKISDKDFPTMGTWWVLVINTAKRLAVYQEFKSKKMVESYFKAKTKLRKGTPHLNYEEFAITTTLEWRENRKTLVDDINILTDTMISPMTRFFLSGKIPLVNHVGGYRFLDKTVKVLDKLEKEEMIWPDDNDLEIKVSRWPEGVHYYAKVGKYDVQDEEGNVKWVTSEQARIEAKKFLKRI